MVYDERRAASVGRPARAACVRDVETLGDVPAELSVQFVVIVAHRRSHPGLRILLDRRAPPAGVISVPSSDVADPYRPQRESRSIFHGVRGLRYHLRCWAPSDGAVDGVPTLFLLHGWMDVSASFQFVVDLLPPEWRVLAPDWRGFGETDRPRADTYWFPDYLGDLDALLDAFAPTQAVDVAGHSMGGNVAMLYAGIRPERVRRLVNLDGLGLPATRPEQAPERYAKWLDALKSGATMRDYPSRRAVAERLMRNNPRLRPDRAAFLALHWSRRNADGRFELLGDPVQR